MKRIKDLDDQRNGWYEISVADASRLLDGRPMNRYLSEHRAQQIGQRITDGKWVANGESIVLTHDGVLLDGQHRLRAAQIAGSAIVAYVVFVAQKSGKVLDTIDTGWARTGGHRLSAEGVEHYNTKAAMIATKRYYDSVHSDRVKSAKADHEEVVRTYRHNKAAIDLAASLVIANRVVGMPGSILGFVAWMAIDDSQTEQMQRFVEALSTGANLSGSNPALILRERLKDQGPSRGINSKKTLLAMTVKAWVAFRDKRPLKLVKWDDRQSFPTFDAFTGRTKSAAPVQVVQ